MSKKTGLGYTELCELISAEVVGSTPQSVNRYLRAIYKTILRQLDLNNKVEFRNFGIFEIKERKSGERIINNPSNGTSYLTYVEPRNVIAFRPSEIFDFAVNENNFKYSKSCENKVKRKNKRKRNGKTKGLNNTADLINLINQRKRDYGEREE